MKETNLADNKKTLKTIEGKLSKETFVICNDFIRNGRTLHLAITQRLRKAAKKSKVWMSKELFITLKNAAYGFDASQTRSNVGSDGIFLLDRDYTPQNEMMRKIFDRFLDNENSEAKDIANELDTNLEDLLPVRLVSHHLRLLGVLARKEVADWIVLVDCDK